MPPETATQIYEDGERRGTGRGSSRPLDEELPATSPSRGYVGGSSGAWEGLDAVLYPLLHSGTAPAPHSAQRLFTTRRARPELDRGEFSRKLSAALEDSDVEAGFTHPGEAIIAALVRRNPAVAREILLGWYGELAHDTQPQALLLLGRLAEKGTRELVHQLGARALASDDLELREAAVHALEMAGGGPSIEALRGHTEQDAVLRDYVQRVVQDLGS